MNLQSSTQVLMIDDDENDAMLVRHMIGKMPDPGCQFRWAASYDQGLKDLSAFNFDLCLVDYQLGAHTGVQVVNESHARGVNCPFLLLTGAGSRAIDLLAMRAGVKGYLEKSRLCPQDLERAIRYAIGSRSALDPSAPAKPSRVPPDVVELLRAAFNSKQAFVVIALMLDREAILRNHLSTRDSDHINADLEALVRARISPRRPARRLKPEAIRRLWRAIRTVLAEAVEWGSTVPLNWSGAGKRDGLFYYGPGPGTPTGNGERLAVYDRAGKPCLAQCSAMASLPSSLCSQPSAACMVGNWPPMRCGLTRSGTR